MPLAGFGGQPDLFVFYFFGEAVMLLYQVLLLLTNMRARLNVEIAPTFDPTTKHLNDFNYLLH